MPALHLGADPRKANFGVTSDTSAEAPHGRRHLVEARHLLSNLSALFPGCESATCPDIRRIAPPLQRIRGRTIPEDREVFSSAKARALVA
jgi:hypothetical protein